MAYVEGISIFATMAQLCRDNNAINLSQGCPDFNCDPGLVELVNNYMKSGFNQYAPMEGVLLLREAISQKYLKLYNTYFDPLSEITITAGATEAIFTAINSWINKGDEVIIFEPAFDSYVPVIKMAGGVPIRINLRYPNYTIPWEEVSQLITNKTKLIIINTPHNPTGTVLSQNDLKNLASLVGGRDIHVLSDEVYEHIIFDGLKHESLALHSSLLSKSFIIGSFGKTFHTTGWRMGYCIAGPQLTDNFRKLHQYVTFSATTPAQYALAEYMHHPENYLHLPAFYQQKRDKFLDLMKPSRFRFIPSNGTYFQLMNYGEISSESDMEFSRWLVESLKVASIPLSPFECEYNDEKIIRFCFAKKEETLLEAAQILCEI